MDEFTSWKAGEAKRVEYLAEVEKIAMIAELKRNNPRPRKNAFRERMGRGIIAFGEWLAGTNANQTIENTVAEAI